MSVNQSFRIKWMLASVVGCAVGLSIGAVVALVLSPIGVNLGLVWVVVGASVGVAQWLVLREQICRAGWWVVASIVGWSMGWGVGFPLTVSLFERSSVISDLVYVVAIWLGVGAWIGAVQWLVLRRQVHQAGWWMLASAVGWVTGWILALAVVFAVPWVVGNSLGGPGAQADAGKVMGMLLFFVAGGFVGLVIGSAVSGVITGGWLGWQLQHSVQEEAT